MFIKLDFSSSWFTLFSALFQWIIFSIEILYSYLWYRIEIRFFVEILLLYPLVLFDQYFWIVVHYLLIVFCFLTSLEIFLRILVFFVYEVYLATFVFLFYSCCRCSVDCFIFCTNFFFNLFEHTIFKSVRNHLFFLLISKKTDFF